MTKTMINSEMKKIQQNLKQLTSKAEIDAYLSNHCITLGARHISDWNVANCGIHGAAV